MKDIFREACPNCGGNFTKGPIRTQHLHEKYPISTTVVYKPVDIKVHMKRIENL